MENYLPVFTKILVVLTLIVCWSEGNAQGLASVRPKPTAVFTSSNTLQVNQPLSSVLRGFADRHNINFAYDRSLIQGKVVSKNIEGSDLEAMLIQLLKPFHLLYEKIDDTHYVIYAEEEDSKKVEKLPRKNGAMLTPEKINLQSFGSKKEIRMEKLASIEKVITGQVIDDNGEPLPGATILEKGTTNGTITDVNGQYALTVSDENAVLVFSFVGYIKVEMALNGRSVLDVTMSPDISSLQEVVIIGYGTQQKKDLTGSVATIPLDRLDAKPNANFAQALQGSLPGINITTNAAGAEQSDISILIRGRNSINASNGPLIILDGIPYTGSISDINPADIESISVLKDASSTAIYGSRGANGVIIIESKKGKSTKPTISYSGYYGINTISNLPDVYDGPGFAEFKETREPGELTDSELAVLENNAAVDWVDLATQTGRRQEHTLSVKGGTELLNYYVSAGIHDAEGVTVNDKFKRYALRVNLSFDITKDLEFGTNTLLTRLDRSGLDAQFSGDEGAYFMNPLTTAYDEFGNLTLFPWPEDEFFGNPLGATLVENDDKNNKVFTSNYLQYTFPFLAGLSFRVNTGIEYDQRQQETYEGRNTRSGFLNGGEADVRNRVRENYLIENILRYQNSFGKHNLDLTGLYSAQTRERTEHRTEGNRFPNDILTFYQLELASRITPSAEFEKWTLLSQMGRVNYNYDGKYFGTFTIRRDGFSGFGDDKKYGTFSSAALAWNISEEAFFPDWNNLDLMKLRFSFGQNGNQAVGPYDNLALLSDRSYVEGNLTAPGFIPDQLANDELGWETTTTFNFGVDLIAFPNGLSFSLDLYRSRTTELLLDRQIPPIYGIDRITQNIGETQNQGIELDVKGDVIRHPNFSWNSAVNFSYNKNEIISLFGAEQDDIANGLFIGQPIRVNYGFVFDGIWQEGDDIEGSAQPGAEPGFVKIKDVANELDDNGEPILAITEDLDREIQGQRDPEFLWGVQQTFSYKNFSLYVFLHGVHGVTKRNRTKDVNVFGGVRRNSFVQEFWTPENPINSYFANDIDANLRNVRFFENADFVRIKDVTLSYNIPNQLFKNSGFSNARIYFTARNLYTFTSWSGADPELDFLNTAESAGLGDRSAIPLQKEFIIGFNFSL